MRHRRREEGWENQGRGRRGSSNSLTFEQGVNSWSSPESQNRLIPTEKEKTAGLSLLPAHNQSTELIIVSKTIWILHISVTSLQSLLLSRVCCSWYLCSWLLSYLEMIDFLNDVLKTAYIVWRTVLSTMTGNRNRKMQRTATSEKLQKGDDWDYLG